MADVVSLSPIPTILRGRLIVMIRRLACLNASAVSLVCRFVRDISIRLASEAGSLNPGRVHQCDWSPGSCCTVVRGNRLARRSASTCRSAGDGPTSQAWDHYGKIRAGLIRNMPARLSIDHHRSQHRLILPRRRSSTISSNIPSTPPLFCCRNRRHFMHRPPKLLFREKLKQPVCRLTLPTIVRFFSFFVTAFS